MLPRHSECQPQRPIPAAEQLQLRRPVRSVRPTIRQIANQSKPEGQIRWWSWCRRGGPAIASSPLFASEQQNYVDQNENGDTQLDDKRPRLVELVDHEIVQLSHGAKLFIHQAAIPGQSDPAG